MLRKSETRSFGWPKSDGRKSRQNAGAIRKAFPKRFHYRVHTKERLSGEWDLTCRFFLFWESSTLHAVISATISCVMPAFAFFVGAASACSSGAARQRDRLWLRALLNQRIVLVCTFWFERSGFTSADGLNLLQSNSEHALLYVLLVLFRKVQELATFSRQRHSYSMFMRLLPTRNCTEQTSQRIGGTGATLPKLTHNARRSQTSDTPRRPAGPHSILPSNRNCRLSSQTLSPFFSPV